jgi:hypothetical protein
MFIQLPQHERKFQFSQFYLHSVMCLLFKSYSFTAKQKKGNNQIESNNVEDESESSNKRKGKKSFRFMRYQMKLIHFF